MQPVSASPGSSPSFTKSTPVAAMRSAAAIRAAGSRGQSPAVALVGTRRATRSHARRDHLGRQGTERPVRRDP